MKTRKLESELENSSTDSSAGVACAARDVMPCGVVISIGLGCGVSKVEIYFGRLSHVIVSTSHGESPGSRPPLGCVTLTEIHAFEGVHPSKRSTLIPLSLRCAMWALDTSVPTKLCEEFESGALRWRSVF